MPEATVLYSVTALVIAGLVVWVAVVLKTAREPWVRAMPRQSALVSADAAAEPADAAEPASKEPADASDDDDVVKDDAVKNDLPKIDADSTARATPVALASEGRTKVAEPKADDEEPADEDKATKAEV